MIGYKTGLACILALVSPLIAAVMGWIWGAVHGSAPPSSAADSCEGCGYDLTGNVSGICPECGLAVIVKKAQTVDVEYADSHPQSEKDVQQSGPSN